MRFIIVIVAFIFSFNIVSAQSVKAVEKANEKIEEINLKILAGYPDLSLSDAQKEIIFNKLLQKANDSKLIQKSDKTDEEKRAERKALNKKVFKEIHKEVLSKVQRNAFTEGKNKLKKD